MINQRKVSVSSYMNELYLHYSRDSRYGLKKCEALNNWMNRRAGACRYPSKRCLNFYASLKRHIEYSYALLDPGSEPGKTGDLIICKGTHLNGSLQQPFF